MKQMNDDRSAVLSELCEKVRHLIREGNYVACTMSISAAMKEYPHAPQPHNLMGILLEAEGNHSGAMKHFRAAWALDPTYLPSRVNLNRYGSFFHQGPSAFDEKDCMTNDQST